MYDWQAVVSDSSILEVLNPQIGSIIFPIKLIDTGALWEGETHDVHVTLICQKTGQEVKLPVSIRLIGQKPEYFGKLALYDVDRVMWPSSIVSILHPSAIIVVCKLFEFHWIVLYKVCVLVLMGKFNYFFNVIYWYPVLIHIIQSKVEYFEIVYTGDRSL